MRSRAVHIAAALLLGAALAAGAGQRKAAAQEEEDLTAGLKALRASFARAQERIENLDFAGAVKDLGTLLDSRRAVKASDLSSEELKLITAAYDLRARAYFNLGNAKAAGTDFESLLRLDPTYTIDRETLSPKVVDLFDSVLKRFVGVMVLDVQPPRARVVVDGQPVDPRQLGQLRVLAGRHDLRVELDGYEPYIETLLATVGAETRKSVRLRPTKRSIEFITVPAGTIVTFDGKPAGATSGPPTADVVAMATRYGFDPQNASAPLPVPLVTPGDHKVTFEHDCYQPVTMTVKVTLDFEQDAPLRFSPVVLKEARADLRISSTPSGADVLIDGDKKGTTPLTLTGLCGGSRDVEIIKPDVGSWSERIRVTQGQINTLDVRLRPTLLYAGTFRLDDWGRAIWSDEDKPLTDELAKGLKTVNLVRSREVLADIRADIIKWMISDPNEVRAGTILPPALVASASAKAHADLVLAGLVLDKDPAKTWTLALYSAFHPAPDVVVVRTDRSDGLREFVDRLDSAPPEDGAWWGMGLVDTLLDEGGTGGPLVVRVLPGSPSAKAGLRAGDTVQMVGDRKVRSVNDVSQALEAAATRPGGLKSAVVLAVQGPGGQRTVRVSPGEAPVVLPLTDASVLYNRALAEFRLRSRAASDEVSRGVALLNLGVAFMHFREFDKANSEGFARATLPPGTGISSGTVQYYQGLCALRRGDPKSARAAFEAAAGAAASTLDTGDGPSAAAAATRMLAALR